MKTKQVKKGGIRTERAMRQGLETKREKNLLPKKDIKCGTVKKRKKKQTHKYKERHHGNVQDWGLDAPSWTS